MLGCLIHGAEIGRNSVPIHMVARYQSNKCISNWRSAKAPKVDPLLPLRRLVVFAEFSSDQARPRPIMTSLVRRMKEIVVNLGCKSYVSDKFFCYEVYDIFLPTPSRYARTVGYRNKPRNHCPIAQIRKLTRGTRVRRPNLKGWKSAVLLQVLGSYARINKNIPN